MTSDVIDSRAGAGDPGGMTRTDRFDRTLRVVMWLDAFLSLVAMGVSVLLLPVVMLLDVPAGIRLATGLVAIVSSVLLAAFGAITGVALLLRMSAGVYTLPDELRLPLPAWMRPLADASSDAVASSAG
ncbi:MAG: hypothetical protein JWO46_475 [Nocardioidaceae bacterium]|nr:hypothetical protein [Nocardioidaceae bacterium]